jgi:uncharacterized protein with HEPN domain
MSRAADERIRDILAAVERCISYRDYLDSDHGAMAYDAILRNLAVIGEAVRALPGEVKSKHPTTPWASIAGLRNVVIHEYFKINPDLIRDVVDNDLAALAESLRDSSAGTGTE